MKTIKSKVIDWLDDKVEDDYNEKSILEELQQYGCVSGMVSDLIYYEDTLKFFNEHKEEINNMLAEMIQETGISGVELFNGKWDNDDPLCLEQNNQNLLAWFGFEETANKYYNELVS
jgi:hypothetical protein